MRMTVFCCTFASVMKRLALLFGFLLLCQALAAQQEMVLFSVPGGFRMECDTLELHCFYPQHHIRYTTNGNQPTAASTLYEMPLRLDESLYSHSDIYTIQISPDYMVYIPDSVQHCIVIRAAVFDEDDQCISEVYTQSYFINALGCDTHGLPVVSLCADTLALFDYETGIFVPGYWFNPADPDWTGNYYQHGKEWERPCNLEFYELDNQGLNQQCGLRTHGGNGRRYPQKNMKLFAREEYGTKRFNYPFFQDLPIDSYKHFSLKPFSSSWTQAGVLDFISNRIASLLNVEQLASRPTLVYLNGEYWGVYFIHETPDERYMEDHFDVDLATLNILRSWNGVVDYGSAAHFMNLFRYMENHDLRDEEAWNYVQTKIDIDNFIDYVILELFLENQDWPANNARCWQINDGPLRWIFFDGDACLNWMTFYAFDHVVYQGDAIWPSSNQATLFFRRLIENDEFRHRFNDRFHELLATSFQYSVTGPFYEEIKAVVEPEVPFQSHRFAFPDSVSTWTNDINRLRWIMQYRVDYIAPYLDTISWGVEGVDAPSPLCYPNPTSGPLRLCLIATHDDLEEIQLLDMTGRVVFTKPCPMEVGYNEVALDLDVPSGIYVLKMGSFVQRIVKM